MALINLVWHLVVQRNVGTALRPEWARVEVPARVKCDVPRMYERDPSQPVHLLDGDNICAACDRDVRYASSLPVWTDDPELWERHPARCNVAYQP